MEKGFILSLIIAAIVALFALNNSAKVTIDFFLTEVEISQAIIILGSTLFGAIIASIMGGVRSLKLKKEIRGLNKIVSENEEQLKISYESLEDEKRRLENLVYTLEEDKRNLESLVEAQKLSQDVDVDKGIEL